VTLSLTRLGAASLLALLAISGDPTDTAAQARGGGGRGRGGIRIMSLTSSAFADGAMIPEKHSQAGRDVSPPLSWSDAPDSTTSFVLMVHDIDAVSGDGTTDVLHWLVWGIPGSLMSLPEGIPQGPTVPMSAGSAAGAPGGGRGGRGGGGGGGIRQISVSGPYYRGPAAPSTGPAHHYLFELYALDTNIGVQPVAGQQMSVTRDAVWDAMKTHIRGKAVLVGLYKRSSP
jgi:Raf kinase inhibitor-like YbhB/YbcL family protein